MLTIMYRYVFMCVCARYNSPLTIFKIQTERTHRDRTNTLNRNPVMDQSDIGYQANNNFEC